jgi:hypothetical protein
LYEHLPNILVCFWSLQEWCCVFQVVSEMASAAGLSCKVDPTLVAALRSQKNGNRITVLSSIRVAQAIYVSHFISECKWNFMLKIFV